MRTKTLLPAILSIALSVAFASPATAQDAGADLTGSWTLTFTTSQGTVNMPIDLRPDGAVLRGTSGSVLGYETDFEPGTVDGEAFGFEVYVAVGNDWYPLTFTGRMEAGALTGNVDIPDGSRASFTGRRAGSD